MTAARRRFAACLVNMAVLIALAAGSVNALAYSAKRAGRTGYWAAIAVDRLTDAVGVSYDFRRARDAQTAALRQCGDADCEVVVTVRNSCAAVARVSKRLVHAEGATFDEASVKTRRKCPDGNCDILAWACTK